MASAANVKFFQEVLISVVQRYPCLWNKKLKEFKDLKVKSNVRKKVAEGVTGTSLSLHVNFGTKGWTISVHDDFCTYEINFGFAVQFRYIVMSISVHEQ